MTIFTRYLYIKEEVENALLISLLKKDANSARFWYEELSGESTDIILQIYFDFYFTNNFVLINDLSDLLSTKYESNLDIYLLKKYVLELDKNGDEELDEFIAFSIWIKERNYKQLAKYILRDCEEVILPYTLKHIGVNIKEFNSVIKLVNGYGLDSVKKYNRTIYLCFIMRFFLLEEKEREKNHQEKNEEKNQEKDNITMKIEEKTEEKIEEKTEEKIEEKIEEKNEEKDIEVDIMGWQKLYHIQKYDIDKYDYLCLFSKDRKNTSREELLDRYRNHWLYYASFSVLWKERIEKYKGIIDSEKRVVNFLDDDLAEEFYTLYGLEPDEQSLSVQNKSIPIINLDKEYIAKRWSELCSQFIKKLKLINNIKQVV